jgi:hypothetical protein
VISLWIPPNPNVISTKTDLELNPLDIFGLIGPKRGDDLIVNNHTDFDGSIIDSHKMIIGLLINYQSF